MARKYKAPEGVTSVSVCGVECKADKKGVIEVPAEADHEQLLAHGLVAVEDVETAPKA